MEYQEILQNARTCMGPYCKACPVCNGQACKNTIPGPGAKGSGTGFARNYQKWQELRVNLDTIGENRPADTSFDFFGHRLALPVMAAPVGAMQLHYGDKYDDLTYNRLLLAACAKAGIVAFTGDGVDPAVMEGATQAIRAQQGCGVPTVKPWDRETLMQKLDLALTADPMAIAMDIDAAGLPFLRNRMPPAGSKTVAELREVAEHARKPFILLDQCPATAEVLPAIADAVGDRVMVLVDGGIRTGLDVFKALALGADGVLIGRPFVTMVYGGGEEGVATYVRKLTDELSDTMAMCGAHSLKEIDREMLWQG